MDEHDHEYEQKALVHQDEIAAMSGGELLAASEAQDGEPGSPWADALA
jgi:hypothetical protein